MKVNRNLTESPGDATPRGMAGRHMTAGTKGSNTAFDDAMQMLELRELLDEVDEVSRQLFRFPSPGLMARYRALVGQLLLRAEKGLRVRKDLRWRRTDRTTYVVIERAERAIAEIEEVLSREGERTRLLELLEEVKGCLISLFL